MDRFTQAYITCALWTGVSDDAIENDMNYDMKLDDIAPETLAEMVADCDDFQNANRQCLVDYYNAGREDEDAGHDFWLTRNGHGAGFWDRGLGDLGIMLTAACEPYGSCDLYLGDDGKVYQS